jgi:hypothetical protein
MPIQDGYECSSEGSVRHWEIPYSRLYDTPPVESYPNMVLTTLVGLQVCGTCLSISGVPPSEAIIDFTPAMVYYLDVRNVITYAGGGGAETVWRAINLGDCVWLDDSALVANVYLTLSAINHHGVANPLFGWVVGANPADQLLYPKGAALVAGTYRCGVMQRGA